MKNFWFTNITILCLTISSKAFATQSVSLIKLLIQADEYEEQFIRVKGYYYISVHNGLFVSKKAAEIFDFASSIHVNDESDYANMTANCMDRYVEIEGKVILSTEGKYELASVSYVFDYDNEDYCWKSDEFAKNLIDTQKN